VLFGVISGKVTENEKHGELARDTSVCESV
jgi:hypothetical protein